MRSFCSLGTDSTVTKQTLRMIWTQKLWIIICFIRFCSTRDARISIVPPGPDIPPFHYLINNQDRSYGLLKHDGKPGLYTLQWCWRSPTWRGTAICSTVSVYDLFSRNAIALKMVAGTFSVADSSKILVIRRWYREEMCDSPNTASILSLWCRSRTIMLVVANRLRMTLLKSA